MKLPFSHNIQKVISKVNVHCPDSVNIYFKSCALINGIKIYPRSMTFTDEGLTFIFEYKIYVKHYIDNIKLEFLGNTYMTTLEKIAFNGDIVDLTFELNFGKNQVRLHMSPFENVNGIN